MWNKFTVIWGVITSFLAYAYGEWGNLMDTLLIVMACDYLIAVLVSATGNSSKTESGGLHSQVGWRGLVAKGISLVIILIAHRIDMIFGDNDFCKTAVTTGFILNEAISIVENCGLLGVPLPQAVKNMIELLKDKADSESAGMGDGKGR